MFSVQTLPFKYHRLHKIWEACLEVLAPVHVNWILRAPWSPSVVSVSGFLTHCQQKGRDKFRVHFLTENDCNKNGLRCSLEDYWLFNLDCHPSSFIFHSMYPGKSNLLFNAELVIEVKQLSCQSLLFQITTYCQYTERNTGYIEQYSF